MSQWPEPTHEADEPPRWPGRVALIALVATIAISTPRGGDWFGTRSWRLPEFSMPQISLPDFSSSDTPPPTASISDAATSPMLDPPTETADGATVQSMPFDACVQTLGNLSDSMGQPLSLIEDTTERRVAVFKFLDSDLTVTCSRAEGTMTVRRRGQAP